MAVQQAAPGAGSYLAPLLEPRLPAESATSECLLGAPPSRPAAGTITRTCGASECGCGFLSPSELLSVALNVDRA
jgi:hypothetical protein